MAEEQALDRVHRIGQSQPVIATRYIVSDSVEEVCIHHVSLMFLCLLAVFSKQYVVSLQRKKMDLIQQSLGSNAAPPTNALKERLKVRCLDSIGRSLCLLTVARICMISLPRPRPAP